MLSYDEKTTLVHILHDITNPLAVIYSSLYVIQMQHPEVSEFKYWNETLADLEELKGLLQHQSHSVAAVNVNT